MFWKGSNGSRVALRREAVHIGELVHSLYEEYRGAAHASGLALGVDATNELLNRPSLLVT